MMAEICMGLLVVAVTLGAVSVSWSLGAYNDRRYAFTALRQAAETAAAAAESAAERARGDARTVVIAIPQITNRVRCLEDEVKALRREIRVEVPDVAARQVGSIKEAVEKLGITISAIHEESQSAVTAARAADAKAGAAHVAAARAEDAANVAYEAALLSECRRILQSFFEHARACDATWAELSALRALGRDRRLNLKHHDQLLLRGRAEQAAAFGAAEEFNKLADETGAELLSAYGLPTRIDIHKESR